MNIKDFFLVASGIITVFCVVPYCLDILRHKTKPNLASWITWTMLTGIATAAAISSAEYRAAFFLASGTIATGLVVALGIKHGYVKYSRFDIGCQIAAMTGIILWQMFNDPLLAIFSSIVVDAVAGLPTLRHSWLKPFEETWQTFAIGCFAAVVGLLGIRDYNLTNASFAIYLIMANAALFTTILYRRQFVKA